MVYKNLPQTDKYIRYSHIQTERSKKIFSLLQPHKRDHSEQISQRLYPN